MIKLIAALGNPGNEYQYSRHNIAWRLVEFFSFYTELRWQNKFNGSISEFKSNDEKIHIILPYTYMNRSGYCVTTASKFFKIKPDQILIIHDELELDFGKVSFKFGGGLGGHNGLRSISESLGTKNFNRFRIGISRPEHNDITSYVLGRFNNNEDKELPFILSESALLLESNLENDFSELEKKFRKIKIAENQ